MRLNFFKYLYPHKKLLWFGIIIAGGLTSLDGIVSPYIIGTLTNILMAKHFNRVPQILVLYLVLFLIITISYWIWQLLWAKARQAANLRMRADVFDHFLDSPSAERIEKVNNFVNVDVKQIEGQYVNSVVNLVYCIEQAVFSLIYVISINGIVSMAFLICGLLPSLIPRFTRNWVEGSSEIWNKSYENYNLTLNEALRGFPVIKHFNVSDIFKKRVNQKLAREENKYWQMSYCSSTASFYSQLSYALSSIAALSVGVLFVVNGQVNVGELISLFLASDRLTSPIITISQIFNQLNTTTPLIKENSILNSKQIAINNLTIASQNSIINFQNCQLGYQNQALLKNVDFTINPHEKVLIVGRSGIGKSTLFKTLLNEIPLISGTIKVASNVANNFGVVGQESYIFSDTLRFNLTLGRKIADEKLITILKKVDLEKFARLKALDQKLGKSGLSLSGGERRKIELARALLAKKEILLVDEGLSGLDKKSSQKIFDLIMTFPGTVLEIEHIIGKEQSMQYDQLIDLNQKQYQVE